MFLLDTVTLSEMRKPQPDPKLAAWLGRQQTSDLFTSVVSIGEIERGIALQERKDPAFASALAGWLDKVMFLFGDQILPFDLKTARRWGQLAAALGHNNADLMIAATAMEHGLTVVTRNTADFVPAGVPTLNPFSPSPRPKPRPA